MSLNPSSIRLLTLMLAACAESSRPPSEQPHYVVVLHLNPAWSPDGVDPARAEEVLAGFMADTRAEVDAADRHGIKLSLWFSPILALYVAADPDRLAEVQGWRLRGHEIGLHHHSTYRSAEWDGYSFLPRDEAVALRIKLTGASEPYRGDMTDLMDTVRALDPEVRSGVCAEALNKRDAMPDEILYSTGSGYLNHGAPGTWLPTDSDLRLAVNEYVSTAAVNGIRRKWLTHFDIGAAAEEGQAEAEYARTPAGVVFSVITHNAPEHVQVLSDFLDFLRENDPQAENSRTVREVMETGLLPEEEITLRCEELGGTLCNFTDDPRQICGGTLLIDEEFYQCCNTSCTKI